MTVEIIFNSTEQTPLYAKYQGQTNCQTAFVELDLEEETLDADSNGEIGNAVPMEVWHKRVLRFDVDPHLYLEDVKELLEAITPFAERVIAGSEIEWNGSNHVWKLNADAEEACAEIENLCETVNNHAESHHVYTGLDFLVSQQDSDEVIDEVIVMVLRQHEGNVQAAIEELRHEADMQSIRLVEMYELEEALEEFKKNKTFF